MTVPARIMRRRALALSVLVALVVCGWALPSSASALSPWWSVTSRMLPSNLKPGVKGTVVVRATNIGNEFTSGRFDFTDVLPAGVTLQGVQYFASSASDGTEDIGPSSPTGPFKLCETTTSSVTCSSFSTAKNFERVSPLTPFGHIEMRLKVKAETNATTGSNAVSVSGGGAPTRSISQNLQISTAPPAFGLEAFTFTPEQEGGTVDTQAGSHPYQLTTTVTLNQTSEPLNPPAAPRHLQFKLPPGFLGNTVALPRCSDLDFRSLTQGGVVDLCPSNTAVGVVSLSIDDNRESTFTIPVFNLVPRQGEPARFGFEIFGIPVSLDTSVRTGADYGVTVDVNNITELASFQSSTVTFWGVPGDSSHDSARGWGCVIGGFWAEAAGQVCAPAQESHPAPFLTMPTACEKPFSTSVEGTAWPTQINPAGAVLPPVTYTLQDEFSRPLAITGCNKLPFAPFIEVKPDGQAASTPTGLTTNVRVPQEVNENAAGLASSSVRDIDVSLPEGVVVNPAGAGGLEACSEAEVGYLPGESIPPTELHFTPTLPVPFCPDASKVGTATIKVPVIKHPLEGAVYLASQNENPFGSLIAMYIVAEDPESGVLVKLPGEVALGPDGQISASFKNSPQAPFEEASLHFFGGSRAPLATPASCGNYTTTARFTPWSGTAPVAATSTFPITSGPNGKPCPAAPPFTPALAAGTTNIQAGAFTPLVTTLSREDGDQDIQTVQLHMPPGLSGVLKGVPLCPEALANTGRCSSASEIGETIVSVGLGGDPYTVTGGKVFLTEGYKGAPFGLSIVNPAKAGPFDLGKVIVRAKIEVDLLTAALTVTTDPIPRILDGIPLQIQHVNVTITRPGFTFNPTNCSKLEVSGSIGSWSGALAPVSTPFQISNCAALQFSPQFSVSTSGKTSKAAGAPLNVKLAYPTAPIGTYANIAKVKVSLPKQLPSRLTTLQKACLAAVFNANPANCPVPSIVGHAKVTTPILPVPLEGNAYFVSHGGEAFPDLTMVLKGYGVTVHLVGSTQIKNGVTTSTFKAAPDVPFNTFELTLPQGPYSALTANTNLCTSKLVMPTEFTAQNGVVIKRNTPISVSGCVAKKPSKAQQLAKALKQCRKKKAHDKRATCERQARKRYGAKAASKKHGAARSSKR
ncbi:MAG TPA: hypothetical protein VL988_06090 [Solirubrobacteraceae bacterium]|nr:hypothetical protein [Solirubrobacteraceae bacterium]